MGLGMKGRGRGKGLGGRGGGGGGYGGAGKWQFAGLGQVPFNHFEIDKNQGRCIGCGCGDVKPFVRREREGYGNITNLDPLLDEVDIILTVSTLTMANLI